MSDDRVEALRQALGHSPAAHALRLMLAEALVEGGRTEEALVEYRALLEAGALATASLVPAAGLALDGGEAEVARRFLEAAEKAGVVQGIAPLRSRLDKTLEDRGVIRLVPRGAAPPDKPAPLEADTESVHFDDIGGLAEVKKVVHRMIILPLKRPDLYAKYGRQAGGGVLLYGPPGCGKTMLARATAGECGLPFFNIRIEDVLDPYMGVSERNLHDSFEGARTKAPCVLFLDELDALGFARRKHHGGAGRPLVDQLLQELDAVGADNRQLLVLAATNAPWDVDDALKRPGRFDRVIFVPPPDEPARAAILGRLLQDRHAEKVEVAALARRTPLFSGADLKALVEQAVDRVIDEALDSGAEPPLRQSHLEAVVAELRPTTLDWLARARNFVEFANRDERYKDVAAFLASKEARRYED